MLLGTLVVFKYCRELLLLESLVMFSLLQVSEVKAVAPFLFMSESQTILMGKVQFLSRQDTVPLKRLHLLASLLKGTQMTI